MTSHALIQVFVSDVGILVSFGYYPQAYRIWKNRSAADVSLTSYVILTLGTNTYLADGFYRHDLTLIAAFFFGAIGSWLVLILTLYYRRAGHAPGNNQGR